jgi:hypothetical protein
MSWLSLHHESEVLAAEAHEAIQRSDPTRAKELSDVLLMQKHVRSRL